ncbi:MAG: nucleotidyltransferase family protein [Pyrinomonadaceae bacterium]
MEETINDAKWNLLQVKVQQHNACRAFAAFESAGFNPVLIKGYAAAMNYPNEIGRSAVDLDLCFSELEFEDARSYHLKNPVSGVLIDFHKGFRHFDKQPWETLFNRTRRLELESGSIRILSPEDHLRVLCVHWLTDGGERESRLWDIYWAVENRAKEFDWNLVFEHQPEHRKNWVIYAIGLAHEFLDLKIDDLPFAEKAKATPRWLKKFVRRAWDLDVPIRDLMATIDDKELFVKQLRKRFPPNPVFSTISMNGSLDSPIRIHYQIGNFIQRFTPKWKAILKTFYGKLRGRNR